ncbi:MAG: hypothetical protein JW720_04820, partial [Sedimentisphaerales bacterium]|nr:hypothetical protein [Sedimentisphaerales bacterium]
SKEKEEGILIDSSASLGMTRRGFIDGRDCHRLLRSLRNDEDGLLCNAQPTVRVETRSTPVSPVSPLRDTSRRDTSGGNAPYGTPYGGNSKEKEEVLVDASASPQHDNEWMG